MMRRWLKSTRWRADPTVIIHPSIFIPLYTPADIEAKEEILRDLLRVNTWLLGGAYHQLCCFILNKYGSLKSFDCLHCTKNSACFECFENYYVPFKEMIEQELFPLSQECGSDEPLTIWGENLWNIIYVTIFVCGWDGTGFWSFTRIPAGIICV